MSQQKQANPTASAHTRAGARGARAIRWTLRAARNVFAVLGVVFVYLLVLGYQQYTDRLAAGDTSCALTRCL
ncbi:hypothetical protein B0G62_10488 [Paraburkholderia eburnea]|uniref:Uncharacterized protein n=1 Tax=Paraburkholderia eburnea TaxID=1189126 RepID=A0A2S4MDR0_9BURK|nr:hypothetical protein [Paraburkholderia eburnea]POR52791.1 hypothetical protein B0G62_10488 [Paraburkholderia eburnea]PRZ23659.1 hypothetical protein BX588_10488 [Paraburkholderia eburnea]